jgi:hypothetical protein
MNWRLVAGVIRRMRHIRPLFRPSSIFVVGHGQREPGLPGCSPGPAAELARAVPAESWMTTTTSLSGFRLEPFQARPSAWWGCVRATVPCLSTRQINDLRSMSSAHEAAAGGFVGAA